MSIGVKIFIGVVFVIIALMCVAPIFSVQEPEDGSKE